MKLYNQLITQIIQNMKINSTSKFVPSFFNAQQDDFDNFESQPIPAPFRQIQNIIKPTSSQNNRKDRTPKIFLEVQSQLQQEAEIQLPRTKIEEFGINQCQQQPVPTFLNGIKESKMILNADFEESSSGLEENCEKIVEAEQQEIVSLPAVKDIGILRNNWSCNSEKYDQLSTKVTEDTNRRKVQVQETRISQLQSINIFQPIKNGQTRCLLRRDKKSASGFIEYNLYLQGALKHLLTARKEGMWQYCMYLRQVAPNGSNSFTYQKIATLQSNFLGNKYTLIKEKEKYSSVTICYQTNILGLSGPRKFFVYLPKTPLPYEYLNQCYESGKHKDKIEKCVSKTAKWSEKVQSYVLNLNGRAKESSIKNFVLTDLEERDENSFIIFGKVGPDVYNLDIQNPYSLLQGLAVALTAFERKLTCD